MKYERYAFLGKSTGLCHLDEDDDQVKRKRNLTLTECNPAACNETGERCKDGEKQSMDFFGEWGGSACGAEARKGEGQADRGAGGSVPVGSTEKMFIKG